MLRLLVAGEDAIQALDAIEALVKETARRAQIEGSPAAQALDELSIMCQAELLLKSPVTTRLTIAVENTHWSAGRIKANERQRRKRTKTPTPSDN